MLFDEGYDPTLIDVPPGTPSQGLGLAAPAAAPAQQYGWLDVLKATAKGGLVGSASARDPLAAFRLMAMEGDQNDRKTRLKQQDERLQLEKYGMSLKVFEEMEKASKWVSDPESASRAGEAFSNILKATGVNFSAEEASNALLKPELLETTKRVFPELERMNLPANQVKKIAEDPLYRERVFKEFEKKWGDQAFNTLLKLKDREFEEEGKPVKMTDVKFDRLITDFADAKYLTDEQKLQLNQAGYKNITSKGVMEAQLKDEPQQQRFEEREKRQREENIARDERSDRTNARLERALAQQAAIFQQSQSNIDKRHMETLQAALQRPLEQTDRVAIAGMEENLNIARKLKTEFTDEERKKYVGIVQNPTARALQLVKGDPKFAKFQTYTNEVKGFAFAEGGKQLTETEKRITWGHLPVGTEFSVADYMANLDRTLERTQSLIQRRVELATTPRNRITTPANQPAPAAASGAKPSGAKPQQSEIEAAKKRLGL